MQHIQNNKIYPLGASIYDFRNQDNIFGEKLDRPASPNPSKQITKDELLIEVIAMEMWMERQKITNAQNDLMIDIKKILDEDLKYDLKYEFYISDQWMGSIDGLYNINFHSIVNRMISPGKMQFTKFDQTIDWTVIPLFGNIERYSPPNYSAPTDNYNSFDDCMKGNKQHQTIKMTERRNVMNNLNGRSHIIKNLKYVRDKDRHNQENVFDCIEQRVWIRDIDGIDRFGPETTGKVMMRSLFNMLYFISLVRVIGHDTLSITLHRINPIKYGK